MCVTKMHEVSWLACALMQSAVNVVLIEDDMIFWSAVRVFGQDE